MKERFFLVLSASGGAGHLRAAEALERSAAQTGFPIRILNYDCLDFTSKAFKKLYAESYLSMVNKAPDVWGYLYQQSEKKPYSKKGLLKLFDHLNYRRYLKTLTDFHPDAIICTHFLPFISVSNEVQHAGLKAPFFAATTDFDVHQYWVDNIVTRYYVFHEESSWQLHSKGVPSEKIFVRGIPLMPEFQIRLSREQVRQQLKIDKASFTVLALSGGFGVGRVEDIARQAVETMSEFSSQQFTLLVVCGKNEKVKHQLERMSTPHHVRLRVFGFVDNIYELMDASDLLISKSGGLTSAEAMAKALPMLIVDPIPGQETRNADLIIEHGAGWRAINLANLSYKLRLLIAKPETLSRMRTAASTLGKPNAATEILEDVYKFLEKRDGGRK
jgi:processive 1,2-diacylglycerol beta-glucosyltransferase